MFDLIQRMKCKLHCERMSLVRLFIYFRNLEDKNFLSLWVTVAIIFDSLNIYSRILSLEAPITIFISSLSKSLFFYLKPVTLYTTFSGVCLIIN